MRFLALCMYATNNGYQQLLLNSLMWTSNVKLQKADGRGTNVQIPHEFLFDVEYWNEHSLDDNNMLNNSSQGKPGDFHHFPKLVPYDPIQHDECWKLSNETDTFKESKLLSRILERGFATPVYDVAKSSATGAITLSRRDLNALASNVTSCERPAIYGGLGGSGRLWYYYQDWRNWQSAIQKKRPWKNKVHQHKEFMLDADKQWLQYLVPRREWRKLAMECVKQHITRQKEELHGTQRYIALHARVELDMLTTECGKRMEKNLTTIFDLVGTGLSSGGMLPSGTKGIFVAISKNEMNYKLSGRYGKMPSDGPFKQLVRENYETLERVLKDGVGDLPVFLCGQEAVQKYYEETPGSIDLGTILPMIIDFQIAVDSTAFVGVLGSTFSVDVWSARWLLGKGDSNFRYTRDGSIEPLENGGKPPAHVDCKLLK